MRVEASFMDEMLRVLVSEGHKISRDTLCSSLSRIGYSVYAAADGVQTIQAIESLSPDVVALSLVLPMMDGYGVLECLRARPLWRYPFVLVMTSMGEEAHKRALALGADEAVAKPVSAEALDMLLRTLPVRRVTKLALSHASAREAIVRQQLIEIGMMETLKGFGYLARAVALVSADERLLRQATRGLYPMLAEECGVSDHSVERAIRHAIEATWTRGRVDALHRVFGNSIDPQRGKPTNVECIAMLAQGLRRRLMLEA